MCKLVYASQSCEPITNNMIKDILSKAHQSNQKNQITGMLFCTQDLFFQVLEGPRDKVNQTYSKILQDKRHQQVTLFLYDQIHKRNFTEWDMGVPECNVVIKDILKKYFNRDTINMDVIADVPGNRLWHLLLEIRHRMTILSDLE